MVSCSMFGHSDSLRDSFFRTGGGGENPNTKPYKKKKWDQSISRPSGLPVLASMHKGTVCFPEASSILQRGSSSYYTVSGRLTPPKLTFWHSAQPDSRFLLFCT